MDPGAMHHGQGQGQGEGQGQGQGQQGGMARGGMGDGKLVAFESMATCAFRLARGEGEAIIIRLAACDVSTMM